MERDIIREIDEIRQQIAALQEAIAGGISSPAAPVRPAEDPGPAPAADRLQAFPGMQSDPHIGALMDSLTASANAGGYLGMVTYLGAFSSADRQSDWIRKETPIDALLPLIENGTAASVLACIGSPERLRILLSLLREPAAIQTLVERCGFGSTGQVYHHIRPLLAADLIAEEPHARGVYAVCPHRVQGIIMLLAGISDMVDPTHSRDHSQI